jgi:peptidyl-prolyl cis-trans isomerase SurA
MMTVNTQPISVDTVITILEKRQDLRSSPLRKGELATRVGKIGESFILEAGSVGLEERNPEFGALMKEYTDGIVLYKVEQIEVWNKTTVSDTALRSYYEQNISKFMLPEQVNIAVLSFESDTLAYLIYDSLKAGADFNAMVRTYREDPNGKSKDGARGLQPVTTDDLTREAASLEVGALSEPTELDNGMSAIIKLIAREPARAKSFEEAGAEVSNAYQDAMSKRLEQQWLDGIRQRYPVKQHKEALKDAFSSPPAK